MKTWSTLILAIAINFSGIAKAEEKGAVLPTESAMSQFTPSVTLRSVVATKYLAFGHGSVLYDNPVVQTDLFIKFPFGIYIDLWNSKSLDSGRWNHNMGNEQDYGIGWLGSFKGFDINIGALYFDEPSIFDLGAGDVLKSQVAISRKFKYFTTSLAFENYSTMPGSGFQGGNLVTLGVSRSVSFWNDRVSVTGFATIAYDDGGFGLDEGFLHRGTVEVNVSLGKHLTLVVPQIAYYVPFGVDDKRELDAVVFGGFSYKF